MVPSSEKKGLGMSGDRKPSWVVDKERGRKAEARETVWLFGLHAVRDALVNPAREKLRLVVTKNAYDKLAEAVDQAEAKGDHPTPSLEQRVKVVKRGQDHRGGNGRLHQPRRQRDQAQRGQ